MMAGGIRINSTLDQTLLGLRDATQGPASYRGCSLSVQETFLSSLDIFVSLDVVSMGSET